MKLATLTLTLLALSLPAGSALANPEYNGRLTGTIDEQSIDIPMVCAHFAPRRGIVDAYSDSATRPRDVDINGDGAAASVEAYAFRVAFEVSLQGKSYKFGTLDPIRFEANGLKLKNRFASFEDGRTIDAFEADVQLECFDR